MAEEEISLRDQFYNSESQSHRRSGKFILIFLGLLILAVIAVGAYQYIASKQKNSLSPTPTPIILPTDTPTPVATATPTLEPTGTKKTTPTPTAIITVTPTPKSTSSSIDKATGLDRSKLTIEVLNGSGIGGAAKKASDALTALGYNVISSGNAESFDYTKTVIEVKSSKSDYLPLLKKDLSSIYTIGDSSSNLEASASANARVIVGKQ